MTGIYTSSFRCFHIITIDCFYTSSFWCFHIYTRYCYLHQLILEFSLIHQRLVFTPAHSGAFTSTPETVIYTSSFWYFTYKPETVIYTSSIRCFTSTPETVIYTSLFWCFTSTPETVIYTSSFRCFTYTPETVIYTSSLLLLLLLKTVSSSRLGESDIHPISPTTPAPQYQPIDRKKRKGERV